MSEGKIRGDLMIKAVADTCEACMDVGSACRNCQLQEAKVLWKELKRRHRLANRARKAGRPRNRAVNVNSCTYGEFQHVHMKPGDVDLLMTELGAAEAWRRIWFLDWALENKLFGRQTDYGTSHTPGRVYSHRRTLQSSQYFLQAYQCYLRDPHFHTDQGHCWLDEPDQKEGEKA